MKVSRFILDWWYRFVLKFMESQEPMQTTSEETAEILQKKKEIEEAAKENSSRS